MRAFINGIQLAYDDTGEGFPVILIHGFPLCRKMWRPQINKLPPAGCRVIAPDLRGFGESDAPDGPYSMEMFADDIVGEGRLNPDRSIHQITTSLCRAEWHWTLIATGRLAMWQG